MNASATLDTLRPRAPDRVGRGAMLALLVHAALIVGLSVAVNWRTHSEPEGVEAELWAAVPQVAAPPAAPPQPVEEPVKPKVTPPPPEPVAKKPPPPPPDEREADIAREKERKAKELKAQQERAAAEDRREKAEKAEKEKADKERLAKEKAEKLKAEQEKLAKAEQARLEDQRKKNLARMQALAGGEGAPGSTGRDAQTAGPSAGYAGRIKARVKPNITFTEDVEGNPTAVVEVRAAPDGTITGKRLIKSSGIRAWDEAVLRAIEKTEVLPRDIDGRVPSPMEISFRPRDL